MQNIQNIIFDLGGVILNIDYTLTEKAFQSLGITNFNELYSQFHANDLFNNLETGKIGEDDFIKELKQYVPINITESQLKEAWNAMLLDFPLQRLQILQQLRNHYRLFLLSNTNAIHLAAFNKILERDRSLPSLGVFFDKSYYSHLVGMRKPNKDIYEFVLQENGLNPAETLFIDDTLPNIATANELGIQTIHLQAPRTIVDIFKPKG
ncbi:putative hydrolase of the HAD superfamily [Chitinophaga skermanii]|uniref:Putative hydrolase of the HAD superfamily n=1 Tax=Chitinophaga skermanii TaxID=331697 RepID=A0A327QAZ3_9BACT|nr:HAD family phosphatase [Chitinophaga skermanii]RAJ01600.1 putative hydrolase of the HAD superfamily [Chitinophaga skermanii]